LRTSGRVEAPPGQVHEPTRTALRDGLRFVFSTPLMVWAMSVDFFATFFSGSMSLLPIVADQVLGVGPVGYGWLAAAPALGAQLGEMEAVLVASLFASSALGVTVSIVSGGLATLLLTGLVAWRAPILRRYRPEPA